MGKSIIGKYQNGNSFVSIFSDGTKIRLTKDNEFKPSFAENIDIKITNKCTGTNCKFCHEGSGPQGQHGDIMNLKFVDSLHPYQEVALGGGNVLEHPDLIPFLQKLKEKKVIANITLHQKHFLANFEFVKELMDKKLIHGLGVSLFYPTDELLDKISQLDNCVLHAINGIISKDIIRKISDKNIKLLILGYKQLRRGEEYYKEQNSLIKENQKYLKENLPYLVKYHKFNLISFDNLAIEQLNVKNIIPENLFNQIYMGDEGSNTFYIDCVSNTFAINSTATFDQRYSLLNTVDDMFKYVQTLKARS